MTTAFDQLRLVSQTIPLRALADSVMPHLHGRASLLLVIARFHEGTAEHWAESLDMGDDTLQAISGTILLELNSRTGATVFAITPERERE